MAATDDPVPFDETAVTRVRRRCFFCESERSDEWKFLERLNAFVCKDCKERLESAAAEERKSG
jgi:aspartyl/asparaginyl beta-hydroxylase (cupin superfamily)